MWCCCALAKTPHWYGWGHAGGGGSSPEQRGWPKTEVISRLGEGACRSQANTLSDNTASVPGVRATAFAGGSGPCSLAGFFNLAPKFIQDNIFIFHITQESDGRGDPAHCPGPALDWGKHSAPHQPHRPHYKAVAIFLRAYYAPSVVLSTLHALNSLTEDRILLGRYHDFFHIQMRS